MRFVGSVAGALALVASLAVAAVGTAGNETAAAPAPVKPPKVANAKAIKAKYGGKTITFIGDNIVGMSAQARPRARGEVLGGHGDQGQGDPASGATRSASYAQLARTLLVEVVVGRRR